MNITTIPTNAAATRSRSTSPMGLPKPVRQPSNSDIELDSSAETGYDSMHHRRTETPLSGSPVSPKSVSDVMEEEASVDPEDESYQSDSTEVTSNQYKLRPPAAEIRGALSISSAESSVMSDRWKNGSCHSCIKSSSSLPSKTVRTSPSRRSCDGSTTSSTKSGKSNTSSIRRRKKKDASPKNIRSRSGSSADCSKQHLSRVSFHEEIAVEVTPVAGNGDQDEEDFDGQSQFDLKSKPGFIGFIKEEEIGGFELLEEHDDDDCLSSGEKSGKACQSTCTGSSSSSSTTVLTKDRVRAFMKDYYEDFDSIFRHGKSSHAIWSEFFKQYYTDEILWVRPTSNTLRGPELADHFAEDIEGVRMQMVSIDSIQIMAGGLAAVVVYTADQEFFYKGTPVADRAVMSTMMHVVNGREIQIGHEHRCAGKPIPKNTRWN